MEEIKSKIYNLLKVDAQISETDKGRRSFDKYFFVDSFLNKYLFGLFYRSSLGYYLNQRLIEPYGIWYVNTPKIPKFPLIIFSEEDTTRDKRFYGKETQMFETLFAFWAYGKERDCILDRINFLLEDYKFGNENRQSGTDNCIVLSCKEEFRSSDMYDENFGEYFKQSRYRIKFRRFPT